VKNKTEVVYLSALESELVESNPSRSRAPVQGIESERIQVSVAGESRSKLPCRRCPTEIAPVNSGLSVYSTNSHREERATQFLQPLDFDGSRSGIEPEEDVKTQKTKPKWCVYLSALESELVEGVQVESNPSSSRAPVQGIQVIESERIQVSVAGESRSKLPVADVPQKLGQSIRDQVCAVQTATGKSA
jgi:hypothetical protein